MKWKVIAEIQTVSMLEEMKNSQERKSTENSREQSWEDKKLKKTRHL